MTKTGRITCDIKRYRRRCHFSQPDLVEAVNRRLPPHSMLFDRVLLSKAETGACILIPMHRQAVAHALGVPENAIYPMGVERSA